MPDASPAKWHLAHTTWFFETFLLMPLVEGYRVFDPAFTMLFNSYYVQIGERHPRAARGMLSRPSLMQVHAYRRHVDEAIARLVAGMPARLWRDLLELGLHHEQQHQELVLMDIQHAFSCNPLDPVYDAALTPEPTTAPGGFLSVSSGLYTLGHEGPGFAFDNEGPRHKVWLDAFEVADGLVTNARYLEFIEDGGYRRPDLWLSDGWALAEAERWTCPLYWCRDKQGWTRYSLSGRSRLQGEEPVLHVSYYEADAFARWAGCRLPTESEWEVAASTGRLLHADDAAWQWTASPYVAYPGFAARDDAVGEYNGKFMVNQFVLRGGSFATPAGHARRTYRNFFPPAARWAFSGIRLARRPA